MGPSHKGRTWTCYAYCTRVGVGTPGFSVLSGRLPFLQPLLNPYFSHTEFGLSFSSPLFFTGVDSRWLSSLNMTQTILILQIIDEKYLLSPAWGIAGAFLWPVSHHCKLAK